MERVSEGGVMSHKKELFFKKNFWPQAVPLVLPLAKKITICKEFKFSTAFL